MRTFATRSTHAIGYRAALLVGAATLLAASPAMAQDTGESDQEDAATQPTDEVPPQNRIVVTATKRDQTIQDVPFSINAQTAEDIRKTGSANIEDISRNVAGLTVQNLGPGQSQVAVRGVSAGQVVRDQPGVKEQVGVYLDESVISLSLFTPDLDLFDLQRVETLRGPQGTLFGSGSVGGTIRYITAQPELGVTESVIEAGVTAIDGGDAGWSIKGATNAPLGDIGAIRIVGYHTSYAGFIDAIGPAGGQDINDGTRAGGRIAMRLEPAPGFSITPRFVYQRIDVNGFNRQDVFNLYANEFTTPPTVYDDRQQYLLLREAFEDETFLADLVVEIPLGDSVGLTSVTSYTDRDILVSRDASALTGSVSVDLGYPVAAVNLPSNLRDTTELQSFTQEVRASSTGEGPFQWVFGAFYSQVDRTYAQRLPTPGYAAATDATLGAGTSAAVANGFPNLDSPYNADLPYDIQQVAVFGEGTYELTERLSVTAGARYYDFEESRQFLSGGLFANGDNNFDTTESDGISPRVILAYDVSDNFTLNAQAAKGFRLGGVNDPLNVTLCSAQDEALFGSFQSYEDETLWNYEVGGKAFGDSFSFSAAAFYNDINNLQVTLDAGSCSSRIVFNVEDAYSAGVEMELEFAPAEGYDVSLAMSYIDAQFDTTLPGALTAATGIRDGNRLPSVPEFQMSAAASYEWDFSDNATGFFGGSFQYVGSRFTQPADQENNPRTFVSNLPFAGAPGTDSTTLDLELPAYSLLNFSAGVDFDSGLSVIVYANNVLDENPLLSFDRERGGRARLGFQVGQPRTFGMTVRKSF
ncbi:TonB-dependent receptor [Blastomonas marina]|uniref:TonB-dependent receptor n=1 Tax=Blastomonas marina TaxID=1867408 RepID=UPI002AC994C7|nr:TonB-dependent receptor [Blastomonas marina]WPZ02699.1 TonB-dependent receptor [Blastomonas marina]